MLLVAVADKYHNARNLLENTLMQGDPFWDRFNAEKLPTLWYYRRLTETLTGLTVEHQGLQHLIRVFEHTVHNLERNCTVQDTPTLELRLPIPGES